MESFTITRIYRMHAPVTVLIPATNHRLLSHTLTGLSLAKSLIPYRTFVFGVNPDKQLLDCGRLDCHAHGPDTNEFLVKCLKLAAKDSGSEMVAWVPNGVFVGDYWLDALLDANWDIVLARPVDRPQCPPTATEDEQRWLMHARRHLWAAKNAWLTHGKPLLTPADHTSQVPDHLDHGPLLLRRQLLDDFDPEGRFGLSDPVDSDGDDIVMYVADRMACGDDMTEPMCVYHANLSVFTRLLRARK